MMSWDFGDDVTRFPRKGKLVFYEMKDFLFAYLSKTVHQASLECHQIPIANFRKRKWNGLKFTKDVPPVPSRREWVLNLGGKHLPLSKK